MTITCALLRSLGILAVAALFTPSTVASEPLLPTAAESRTRAVETFGTLPERMPGSENDTPAMVDLGQKLFMDKRLSANQTQSCNSCHSVDNQGPGADGKPTSEGAFGKRGGRNSPTVLNAGLHFAQFWDGRAATLEEQAKGPILNPIEMAMPNEKEVLERLGKDKEMQAMFAKAFPQAKDRVTYDHVAQAIAAFERTLLTRDRLDDFQKGADRALSPTELAGLNSFVEIGCATCHNGPMIGANAYHKVGLVNAYKNASDQGRFEVTKDESDRLKFKVPSLRNVALTQPYFHDGSVGELDAAVTQMAWLQLGRELTGSETKSIVAFLQALSDKERARAGKSTTASGG